VISDWDRCQIYNKPTDGFEFFRQSLFESFKGTLITLILQIHTDEKKSVKISSTSVISVLKKPFLFADFLITSSCEK
jgi:hypothetical protein